MTSVLMELFTVILSDSNGVRLGFFSLLIKMSPEFAISLPIEINLFADYIYI